MNYQKFALSRRTTLTKRIQRSKPRSAVFFDNITAHLKNATTEYVKVNVTFGVTNESTLTGSVDNARGAVVIRLYQKRQRTCAEPNTTEATDVLET